MAGELHRLGLLTALDINILAAYCLACARWKRAEGALAVAVEADVRLTLEQAATSSRKAMTELGAQLGLSPLARSRIGLAKLAQPPGKFDGLLTS